jgi:hypothetical protein
MNLRRLIAGYNKSNEHGMIMLERLYAHFATLHSCINSPKHYHPVISGVRNNREIEKLPKYCVFCGEKPNSKTKEHVIPHWLIALTGDPKRKVNLGMIKTMDEKAGTQRQYSFDSFTFPACDKCNQDYSDLEGKTKSIVEKILRDDNVTTDEISVLLDWFDKVRVGLWLGYHQLDKNIADISPTFHIATRIGQYDRALFVAKSDATKSKLNFGGPDSLSFSYTPSAFTLIINNYYFTNISYYFLFSRRIGFPYPKTIKVLPEEESNSRVEADISEGQERIMQPLIRFPAGLRCIEIYQPMFKCGLIEGEIEHYSCDYVRANSLDFNNGVGAIYRVEDGIFTKHLNNEEVNLSPRYIYRDEVAFFKSAITLLKWQNHLNTIQPDVSLLTKELRAHRKTVFNEVSRINNYLIKSQEKHLENL